MKKKNRAFRTEEGAVFCAGLQNVTVREGAVKEEKVAVASLR